MKFWGVMLTIVGGVLPIGAALVAYGRAVLGRRRLRDIRTEWKGLTSDRARAMQEWRALKLGNGQGNPANFNESRVLAEKVEPAREVHARWKQANDALADRTRFPSGPTNDELQVLGLDADMSRFADTIESFKVEGIVALVGIICATVGSVMGFYA